jgi:hypothetical protein
MTGTLHKDICTFIIIFCKIVLRKRNISDKSCRENQNNKFFSKNCAIYEITWKNIVEPYRPQMTI